MVNIRLALIGKRPKPSFPRLPAGGGAKPARERAVYFADARKASPCPVYQRETLGAGSKIAGPALIQEHGTTTVLFAQDALTVAPSGELIITVGAACWGCASPSLIPQQAGIQEPRAVALGRMMVNLTSDANDRHARSRHARSHPQRAARGGQ